PAVSAQREQFLTGLHVPDLDRAVVARRCDALAVEAERRQIDATSMAAQNSELAAVRGVPDPDRGVQPFSGDRLTVWTEAGIRHGFRVAVENESYHFRLHVPDPDLVPPTVEGGNVLRPNDSHKASPVRAERSGVCGFGTHGDREPFQPGSGIANSHPAARC